MTMFIVKGWKCGPQTLYYLHGHNTKGYKCKLFLFPRGLLSLTYSITTNQVIVGKSPFNKYLGVIISSLFYYNYSNSKHITFHVERNEIIKVYPMLFYHLNITLL
jgi:hypothetical protein